LRVLADNNGKPGNTLLGPLAVTLPSAGTILYNLTAANLVVHSDFYVMIEYDGTSAPYFGLESTPPIAGRSWDFDGPTWSLNAAEDFIIRAVVEYTTTGVDDRNNDKRLPETIALAQNYPNPFNPETNIRYALPHDGKVTLAVFDLTGRQVALLESGMQTAGEYTVRWNGRDSAGNRVTSGVYFYRLEATSPAGIVTILTFHPLTESATIPLQSLYAR
jgi:hypothetical protein